MRLMVMRISHGLGRGTHFFVQVDPTVEQFIASLGDGTAKPVQEGSFLFSDDPMEQYEVRNGEFPLPHLEGIRIDSLNRPFVMDDAINLSFLRLKGLSNGLHFSARIVMSTQAMDDLKLQIGRAVRRLCREFILPSSTKLTLVQE